MERIEKFNKELLNGAMEWLGDHPATLAVGCGLFAFLCTIACSLVLFIDAFTKG